MSEYSFFLVDDDIDDQFIFFEALTALGIDFRKQTARDGVFALELIKSSAFEKPDIIFVDLNMPRMNGHELLILLRRNPDLNGLPIIIYSTSISQHDIDHALDLGADACMCKHNSFETICSELRTVLKQHLPGIEDI